MTLLEAIEARHSVRAYDPAHPIEAEKVAALQAIIDECNAASGLHLQLITGDKTAFGDSWMAHYGKFSGIDSYIAIVGKKSDHDLDEKGGYYGEKLVLEAQRMGLNTCWVALTFKRNDERIDIGDDERLVCVISIGYGMSQGVGHRIKTAEQVSTATGNMPEWFTRGVQAALLAPTAINQQKFHFTLMDDGTVRAVKTGWKLFAPYSAVDLGIVKLHFEVGAAPHVVKFIK